MLLFETQGHFWQETAHFFAKNPDVSKIFLEIIHDFSEISYAYLLECQF